MLRIKDRHERDMLYGPTNEEMITEIFRAYVRSYKDLAAQSVSHPMEVPRRGAPAFRADAGPGISDEGRIFIRPRSGRRARIRITRCLWLIFGPLRDLGLKSIPMRAEYGADRRQSLATNSLSSLTPASSRSSATKIISTLAVPAADVDFDDVAGLQAIVDKWTSLYAATSEKHDAAAFAKRASRKASIGARH